MLINFFDALKDDVIYEQDFKGFISSQVKFKEIYYPDFVNATING